MNEAQYLASDDPKGMLDYLLYEPSGRGGGLRQAKFITERQLRLFVSASLWHVCRRGDPPITVHQRAAILELERFADDGNEDGLFEAWQDANLPRPGIALATYAAAIMHARMVAEYPMPDQRRHECNVLRDIRPYRLAELRRRFAPLPRTPTVLSLATAAYQERPGRVCGRCVGVGRIRPYPAWPAQNPCPDCHGTGRIDDGALDPARLAVLSDALVDEGCDDPDILQPLRGMEACACLYGYGPPPNQPQCVDGWRKADHPRYRGFHVLDTVRGVA